MWGKIISLLIGALASSAASLVGRCMLALGLGYVTYKGFDLTIGWLLDQIKSNLAGLPIDTLNFLGFLWVDKAIGLLFSTYTAATLVKLAGSTNITKMVTKG